MHYRNGREAVNGDPIICLDEPYNKSGILYGAVAGNDYCNGHIQTGYQPTNQDPVACLCDCLRVDDLTEILKEKGLDKRPEGM
jgi:hypothetical protein